MPKYPLFLWVLREPTLSRDLESDGPETPPVRQRSRASSDAVFDECVDTRFEPRGDLPLPRSSTSEADVLDTDRVLRPMGEELLVVLPPDDGCELRGGLLGPPMELGPGSPHVSTRRVERDDHDF